MKSLVEKMNRVAVELQKAIRACERPDLACPKRVFPGNQPNRPLSVCRARSCPIRPHHTNTAPSSSSH